jgi:hypothetical protein
MTVSTSMSWGLVSEELPLSFISQQNGACRIEAKEIGKLKSKEPIYIIIIGSRIWRVQLS